jgi:P pilus assembly chaperone PapD
VAPDIKWHATRDADGKLRISATNTGNAHVQVGKLDLLASGQVVGTRQVAEYVLPGSTRSWAIDGNGTPAVGAKLHISATSDSGPLQSDVALETDTTLAAR